MTASSDLGQDAGIFHAAQEAARHDLALRDAVGELRADPGAGHQAAALLLGHQEAEARRAAARNRRRRSPPPRSSTNCRPRRPAAPPGAHPGRPSRASAAMRFAGHHHVVGLRASRRPAGRGIRWRSVPRFRRAPAGPRRLPSNRRLRRRPPLCPVRLSTCGTAEPACCGFGRLARTASTPRVRLP